MLNTLSAKIVAAIVGTLTIVLAASTYLTINSQSRSLIAAVQLSAERSSSFAKKALRQGMEENNQSNLWRTINDLGSEIGVERIRIIDKRGTIRYSTLGREAGTQVDMNADACVMCHGESTDITRTQSDQYVRVYMARSGHRVLGFINPIRNEKSCWTADCHAHSESQTILGVLDVQMSLEAIDAHIEKNTLQLIITSVITLAAVGFISAVFVLVGVHSPVKKFIAGIGQIASGNLRHRIVLNRNDEIGALSTAFNEMASELYEARRELLDWSEKLEEKVEQKTAELQSVREQVVHMEKMASLGKLSSMIAHELNNPLSGILTLAKLVRKRLDNKSQDPATVERVHKDLTLIADEARRCGDIVRNLLFFARAQPRSANACDLDEIIERSLRLVQHQINLQEIEVTHRRSSDQMVVHCDEGHIQQVLVALIINAIEAMPDGGSLKIETEAADDGARIRVADSGIGILPSDLQRIFEPFFTTKESGYGTGLGLSIVYGIIKQHGGDIQVDSKPGNGTVFTIHLPEQGPPLQDSENEDTA